MIQINKDNAKRLVILITPFVAIVVVLIIIILTVFPPNIHSDVDVLEHEDDGQLVPFGEVRQLSVSIGSATNLALTQIESAITNISKEYLESDTTVFAIANIIPESFQQLSNYPKICTFVLKLNNDVEYDVWARVDGDSDDTVTTIVKDSANNFYVSSSTKDPGVLTNIKVWLQNTIHVMPEIHFVEDDFDVEAIPGFNDVDEYDSNSFTQDES